MTAAVALSLAVAVRWICPADFSPLPAGWIQGNLGASVVSANSWAHTPGFTNLDDIRPGDIYVWTLLIRREPSSSAPSAREPLRLPLTLNHAEVATQEGSTLPEYRFAGRYRGYFADIRVDFGSQHPHAHDVRRANNPSSPTTPATASWWLGLQLTGPVGVQATLGERSVVCARLRKAPERDAFARLRLSSRRSAWHADMS